MECLFFHVVQAANYLDIKSLLDILCRTVAEMIKGKDPEEIRRRFHASNPAHLAASDTPPSSPGPSPLPHLHSQHHHHSSTTLSSEDTKSYSSIQENDTQSLHSSSSGLPHAEQLRGARETSVWCFLELFLGICITSCIVCICVHVCVSSVGFCSVW